MQPPPAHIVAPSIVPAWVAWLAAGAMYASALALAVWRRGRAVLLAAGGLGVAGTVAVLLLSPTVPASPGYTIGLAVPAARPLTSPFPVTVCGHLPDGSPAAVPGGGGNLLTVFLDGRQVLETRSSPLAVDAPPGTHELRVEALSGGHREFQPPITASLRVDVGGTGPLSAAASCPGR